jgi:hypothetical protein
LAGKLFFKIRYLRLNIHAMAIAIHLRSDKVNKIIHLVCDKKIRTTAFRLALIVGPLLTLINQYDVLFEKGFLYLNWLKVALSLFMPYAVSTFSAVKSRL